MKKERSGFKFRKGVLFLLPEDWKQKRIQKSAYPRPFPSHMFFIFSARCWHPFLQIQGPLTLYRDREALPGTGWLVTNASKKPWKRREFYANMHEFAREKGFEEYWQILKIPLFKRRKMGRFQVWQVHTDRSPNECETDCLSVDDSRAKWRGGICFQALIHFQHLFPEAEPSRRVGEIRFTLGDRYETWVPKKKN